MQELAGNKIELSSFDVSSVLPLAESASGWLFPRDAIGSSIPPAALFGKSFRLSEVCYLERSDGVFGKSIL